MCINLVSSDPTCMSSMAAKPAPISLGTGGADGWGRGAGRGAPAADASTQDQHPRTNCTLCSYTTPTTPITATTPILHVPPRVPTILTRILRLHTRRHRAPTSPSVRPRTDLAFPQSMSAIRISRAAEPSFTTTTTTNQPKSWLMRKSSGHSRVVARDFRCPNANIYKEVGSVPLSVLPPQDHSRLSNFFFQPEVRPEGEYRVSFSREMCDALSTLASVCVCSSAVVVK